MGSDVTASEREVGDRPTVAAFRPDDERIEAAVELLVELGVEPIADPMLAIESTGRLPREDADHVVLTSKTGVDVVADAGWEPGEAALVAIGEPTAETLREAGYRVDVVPEEYTSSGLVEALADRVAGQRVEVARSDHGSDVLLDGLREAGAYVHETILYELVRPEGAGESAALAARGELDAALFTSSLTVEHFFEAAVDRGLRADALRGLNEAVVGAIGPPTEATAGEHGVDVDVVPDEVTFETLARAVVRRLRDGQDDQTRTSA